MGLEVTDAAAVGTPAIAYNVDGSSDSVRTSSGVLSAPNPKEFSSVLQEFLSTWVRDGMPDISSGGVNTWSEVANRVLAVATSGIPNRGHQRVSMNSEEVAQPDDFV